MRSGTPGFQPSGWSRPGIPRPHTGGVGRTDQPNEFQHLALGGRRAVPEPEALEALSLALNLPIAFFLRPLPDHGPAPMFFRSMANTTQSVRKRTQARLRWAQDIALSLQEWVDLPKVNVPCLEATDHREIGNEDIERMANECRSCGIWALARFPTFCSFSRTPVSWLSKRKPEPSDGRPIKLVGGGRSSIRADRPRQGLMRALAHGRCT